MNENIYLKPIEESLIPNMVTLHLNCFTKEKNYSMHLGKSFLTTTYRFFCVDKKSFGFVAFSGEKPIGLITGRLDYYVDAVNQYRKWALLKGLLLHPFVFINPSIMRRIYRFALRKIKPKKINQLISPPSHAEGKTATLASLCVLPEYTKLKVTDLLIGESEKYARMNQMEILRTGIANDNLKSRFAFKIRGYLEDKVLSGPEGLFYYLILKNV